MLFSDTYLTIEKTTEAIFKDKGSKFLAFAYPVENDQQIKEILNQLKKEHHTANHHCYAYRLGADKMNFRANPLTVQGTTNTPCSRIRGIVVWLFA